MLFDVLNQGFISDEFSDSMIRGTMILSPRPKGHPLIMTNKWRFTLLNTGVKVSTTSMNERVEEAIRSLISYLQHGFLKGLSIHQCLLLTNEIVHLAVKSGLPKILLKLDIIKVFDSLEWSFLVRLMIHMGLDLFLLISVGPLQRTLVQ